MAKEGDKLKIDGREYEVDASYQVATPERPLDILVVVERGLGIPSMHIPAKLWEAAVRGAVPFPTDDDLGALKDRYDELVKRTTVCYSEPVTARYIHALEGRVRKLEAENREWQTANSKAVEGLMEENEALTFSLGKIHSMAANIMREAVEDERQDEGDG
jgi:hypothetical protein